MLSPSRKSAILIAAVLALAGCGGDDDGDDKGGATGAADTGTADTRQDATGPATAEAGEESDRRRVQAALDQVFERGDDPSNCERVYTERYVNDSFGKDDPLKECQKQQRELYDPDDRADSVKILQLDVRGDEVDADIAVEGGTSDGIKFDVKLVREGDVFQMDELEPK